MSASPVFIGTPKVWQQALSVANTARDGTGTLADVLTSATNGSRVDKISVIASGTTTAGVVRIFLYDGTNTYLRKEILVDAITPSTTIKVWEGEVTFVDGLVLPATWHLKASTHNAETFKIFVQGGDI